MLKMNINLVSVQDVFHIPVCAPLSSPIGKGNLQKTHTEVAELLMKDETSHFKHILEGPAV
jgi:hypothetical protein